MSFVQASFEVQILRPDGWKAVRAAINESKAVKQALRYAEIPEVAGVRVVCNVKSGQRIHLIKTPAPPQPVAAATRYRAPWWMTKEMAAAWESLSPVQRDLWTRVGAAGAAVISLCGFALLADRMFSNVEMLVR